MVPRYYLDFFKLDRILDLDLAKPSGSTSLNPNSATLVFIPVPICLQKIILKSEGVAICRPRISDMLTQPRRRQFFLLLTMVCVRGTLSQKII